MDTPATSLADAIADLIREALPIAEVTGVETVDEMLANLSSTEAPITVRVVVDDTQIEKELGCLVRGAGEEEDKEMERERDT